MDNLILSDSLACIPAICFPLEDFLQILRHTQQPCANTVAVSLFGVLKNDKGECDVCRKSTNQNS
jgi:hypothetical protein